MWSIESLFNNDTIDRIRKSELSLYVDTITHRKIWWYQQLMAR